MYILKFKKKLRLRSEMAPRAEKIRGLHILLCSLIASGNMSEDDENGSVILDQQISPIINHID